jgi:hypothetical protein
VVRKCTSARRMPRSQPEGSLTPPGGVAAIAFRFTRGNAHIEQACDEPWAASLAWQALCLLVREATTVMTLESIRARPPMKLTSRSAGDLHAALAASATYSHQVIGEPINLWSLVAQMLLTFTDSDRAFHGWTRPPSALRDVAPRHDAPDGQENG